MKYRGIFFNDEAPALTHYVYDKYGSFNHEFYGHVFELLLRLKANYLWPAMWQARTGIQEPTQGFHEDDPENGKTADLYGIVMGTSHHEPMTRSQKEWKVHGQEFGGVWNYQTNEAGMTAFWTGGIEKTKNFENVITLGMRGDGDMALPSAGSPQANRRPPRKDRRRPTPKSSPTRSTRTSPKSPRSGASTRKSRASMTMACGFPTM